MMRVRNPIGGAGCRRVRICLASTTIASAATIAVPAGGNLQAALDAAKPGDVITLGAGRELCRQLRAAEQGRAAATTSRSDPAAPDAVAAGPERRA